MFAIELGDTALLCKEKIRILSRKSDLAQIQAKLVGLEIKKQF